MGTLPGLPAIIEDTAIDLTPVDPGFKQSFADTVGNAATNTDGFDSIMLQVVTDLATVPDLISSLDPDLNDVGSALPDVSTPWEQTYSGALADAITQGDGDFQQYNVHLTGNTPPAPGPQPGQSCDFSIALTDVVVGTAPQKQNIPLFNSSSNDLVITNATWYTADPDILSHDVSTPQTVGPNGQLAGTVTVTPLRTGSFVAQLTLTAKGISRPNIICLTVNVLPASGSSITNAAITKQAAAPRGTLFPS